MITRWRGRAALLTAGAAVPAKIAALGTQGTAVNTCSNPVVDRDLTGWGRHAGGSTALARVPVSAHVAASSGAWLNDNSANPAMFLPQKLVTPGERWSVGVDSWVDRGGSAPKVVVEVDWFTAAGTYLSHTEGTAQPVPSGPTETWTRAAAEFTVPPNAARMNPLAELLAPAGVSWIATACDIRPITTPPSTEVKCPTTAAAAFGWGTPRFTDNFDRTSMGSNWGLYDGPGHEDNGTRRPEAFTVDGDVVTITGTADGRSGGADLKNQSLYRDRIETCMRAPVGDDDYHPVLTLWPDAEDWPVGGEVDYAEIFDPARQEVNFFLHYGRLNLQTGADRAVNATTWHSYAMDWTSTCMIGYVDAVEFFRDCDTSHFPPRDMHATIQLDAFGGDSGYTQSTMHVDSLKIWDGA